MRLVVTLEARFTMTPDGKVWTDCGFSASFWQRYLSVFEAVRVVARARHENTVSSDWRMVNDGAIDFFPIPYYVGPYEYLKKRKLIRSILRDAVHTNDAVLMRVGSRIADDLTPSIWKLRKPYGLEVVTDPYEVFAPGAVRHAFRPLFRMTATRNLKRQCARATAVSYVTQRALQSRYPASTQIGSSDVELTREAIVDQPKVQETYFSSVELNDKGYVEASRSFGNSSSVPRLVFVGSLAQMYKGVDVLLYAIKHLMRDGMRVNATIIGEGKHRGELENLSHELGIEEQVRFAGQVTAGCAIRAHLDRADLFVMPSRTEGLPRAMIEAMARALPCIGSDAGGIPELLDPEYLVRPGDAASLAAKIRHVLLNPAQLNKMSARNLLEARKYSEEILEARRNRFYRFLRERTEEWLRDRTRKSLTV